MTTSPDYVTALESANKALESALKQANKDLGNLSDKYQKLEILQADTEAKYAEAIESKWIKVKDRLPESNVWVLCLNETDNTHYKNCPIVVGKWCPDPDWASWYYPNGAIATPTHWQPLPPAPD